MPDGSRDRSDRGGTVMNGQTIRNILVVDDDPDIRTMLEIAFVTEGYAVTSAGDGKAAVDAAVRNRPELIVLDVMMPGVDGIDVLRSLKSDPRTADVPVVLLTAKSADADVWAGWEAGADYYITKPFECEELFRFIDHLGDPEGPHLRVV